VGCRVVFPSPAIVPIVVRRPWRHPVLQPVEDVLPETRLVVVDEDRRRDMHGRDEHHSLVDAGGRAAFLDFLRNVDDLLAGLRVERQIRRVKLHGSSRLVGKEVTPGARPFATQRIFYETTFLAMP